MELSVVGLSLEMGRGERPWLGCASGAVRTGLGKLTKGGTGGGNRPTAYTLGQASHRDQGGWGLSTGQRRSSQGGRRKTGEGQLQRRAGVSRRSKGQPWERAMTGQVAKAQE